MRDHRTHEACHFERRLRTSNWGIQADSDIDITMIGWCEESGVRNPDSFVLKGIYQLAHRGLSSGSHQEVPP